MAYRIFTINPGSTSTKIALFEGEDCLFSRNISHAAEDLAKFGSLNEQLDYRMGMILDLLAEQGIDLASVDAYVGRGGGLLSMEGGTYVIDELLLDHAVKCKNGVVHPATLGPQIASALAGQYGKPAYVVNPPDTDEYAELARVTGVKGVYRHCHLHALNLKETAIRHAALIGRKYEDCNFIVCHLGGGVSISAHLKGKMVDGNDIVAGEGPMAPTRCGSLPVSELLGYLAQQNGDVKALRQLCTRSGGFVSLLGTSSAQEVSAAAETGSKDAWLAWHGMIYQVAKYIGSMAAVLQGKVDGILLGGGMVHNQQMVDEIKDYCEWIAPVTAYPGEFEMEAMAAGAIRVLSGEEEARAYSGEPRWTPPAI